MEFDDDRVDLSDLDDRRGSGGYAGGGSGGGLGAVLGSGLAVRSLSGMGGLGVLILIGLLVLSQCQGGSSSVPGAGSGASQVIAGDPRNMAERCVTQRAILAYDDCYVLKSMNEINEVWTAALPEQAGVRYRKPRLVYFDDVVRTGCGTARSDTGPFYCPPDQAVYIDLGYMDALFKRIGASGRFAQTYVVAHEVGHHLQTVLGTEAKVRAAQQRNPKQANALSVRMELQADCYAGVYAALAGQMGNQRITAAEFQQALVAAAAVGDDSIMKNAGMRVNPDDFTHGSAADRQTWFDTGYRSGSLRSCTTFS